MAQITSSVGLISGINTSQIIDELMSLEEQPVTQLQNRISTANQQQLAYTDLQTRLSSLQITGQTLEKPSTFQASNATSSNENVLTATTTNGAPVGSYQFQVAQLAQTQFSTSNDFPDSTSALVGAGTLTFEQGGGELTNSTNLDDLNGGAGIPRGQFRITDKAGNTDIIDLSNAVTVDDVLTKINSSLDISVQASYGPNGLVINDTSGGSGNFEISDVGGGKTAASLGIVANTAGTTVTGTDINYLGRSTSTTQLNDGLGIRNSSTGVDFAVTTADGTTTNVTLGKQSTLGGIVDAINSAGNGKFHAVIPPNSNSIQLVDNTVGGGTLSVAALGSSNAAADLGLLGNAAVGDTITGSNILTSLGTVSLRSLNGGSGLSLDSIRVTNAAGNSSTIDLSSDKTVADVLNTLNNSGLGLTASLNQSSNGIQITDSSGGSGPLVIEDVGPDNSATALGIAGSFTSDTVSGANLQRQWVNENTLLSSYNGGKGVALGQFTITNPNHAGSQSYTVDLTTGNVQTIGDVIDAINGNNVGVTASINQNGDGIVLTDTTGGAGQISTTESGSTTAADLNILGTGDANHQINGSFEKTLAVTDTDTLTTLQTKINNLNAGVTASIGSDGHGGFQLHLLSTESGTAGRVNIDSGTTSLGFTNLANATDAAVFLGSSNATKPVLITSNQNNITTAIPGVSLQLNGVSAPNQPVSLSITRDPSNIIDQLNSFVQNFNDTITKINSLTAFDPTSNTAGLLLGDSAVQQVQQNLYQSITSVVNGVGKYATFADIGLTITNGAQLSFDSDTFSAAFAADPDSVQKLFTAFNETKTFTPTGGAAETTVTPFGNDASTGTDPSTGQPLSAPVRDSNGDIIGNQSVAISGFGLGYALDNSIKQLIDPTNGVITLENNTLEQQTTDFQNQINDLNDLLADKRNRLEEQFANMETVLAGLQSQGQALSSLTGASTASTAKSTTSSSSS